MSQQQTLKYGIEVKCAREVVMELLRMRLETTLHFGEGVFPFETNEARAEIKRAMDSLLPPSVDEMDRWEFVTQLFGDAIEEANLLDESPFSTAFKQVTKCRTLKGMESQPKLQFICGHVFSLFSNRNAQKSAGCKLCGAWYDENRSDCRVSRRLREFVAQYAAEHGWSWKEQLRKEWNTSCDELILQSRDIIGKTRLRKLKVAWLWQ